MAGWAARAAEVGGSFCQLTDPNGNTIKQEFDQMGRVVTVTDSLGHSTFTTYDKAGVHEPGDLGRIGHELQKPVLRDECCSLLTTGR